MEIEKIIYETTREIYSVEDKLSIATIFIFCYKVSSVKFAELLYTKNKSKFIDELNSHYKSYEVDFKIKLDDRNIKNCFNQTLEKVIRKYDDNGYYKALFEKDEYALVIYSIVNYNFDQIEFKKLVKNINQQLTLF